jgi:hypothetical protein
MQNFSSFPNSINKGLQQVNVDYDPYVIKPPSRDVTHGSIARHLLIDSRERNVQIYPSSSKYRIEVQQEYKDVTSVELTLAQIPNTFYNIHLSNNIFYISENDTTINQIEIQEGQYTNESLIDTLNGKYGDLFFNLTSKYNFSRNPINMKLRIQSNRATNSEFIYNIKYNINDNCSPCKNKSIDRTIGFLNTIYTSEMIDLSYITITSITDTTTVSNQDYPIYKLIAAQPSSGIEVDFTNTFYVNDYFQLYDSSTTTTYSCQIYEIKNDNTILFEVLNGLNPSGLTGNLFNNISVLYSPNIFQIQVKPYVILKIRDFTNINSNATANNSYTVIPLTGTDTTIINNATGPVHGIIKYFNPPLSRMPWMDIEFLNYDGSLFDFRGQENILLFTINMLNQPGKYNNYINNN